MAENSYKYKRRKARHPVTGEYRDVYGKTWAEVQQKKDALEAAWARELEISDSPYFYQYAAAWFSRVSPDMSESRRATIAREINQNLCPVIGEKKLVELTSDDVMDVMAARTARSKAARSLTLQTLNRILDAAVDAGKLQRNPGRAKTVSAGGQRRAPKTALTREQEAALLAAVAGKRIELFCRIGLYTGLRREEICGLQWQEVHLDAPTPYLDVRHVCRWVNNNRPQIDAVGKSDAAWRSVGIPPALLPHLQQAREEAVRAAGEPLSGRTVLARASGDPWTYQTFNDAWDAIRSRTAGPVKVRRKDPETGKMRTVEINRRMGEAVRNHPGVVVCLDFDVTPHKLRRTYITRLILGGADPRRVQYLAGHATVDVTLEYYTDLQDHQPEDLAPMLASIFPGG